MGHAVVRAWLLLGLALGFAGCQFEAQEYQPTPEEQKSKERQDAGKAPLQGEKLDLTQ